MTIQAACLLLATLVVCSQGVDVKYSELVAGKHVVDMGMTLSFKDSSNESPVEYNEGKPCTLEDTACQDPKFTSDDDSELILTLTPPKNLADKYMKKAGDLVLLPPTSLTVKLCFATPWTSKRKWRKIKDTINDDKRCKNKVIKKLDLASVSGGTITESYKIPSDTPRAQWYFTAFLECDVDGKDDTAYCGLDTTGGLIQLAKEEDVISAIGAEGDAQKALDATTSQELHIFTTVRESRPTGLYVAVIIMSGVSLAMLFGFFAFEQILKKNK
ncbi:hypothetical protein BSKO_06310 [Bryopsis sp. KO-2023]|nr:hypothetical protein BSKO_06310 [Bryopsis sp. KO-2023]